MRRAFTLLEVLLAIGLIGALSGGLFAFMFQIASQKAALASRAMDGQAGDAVFERMESDLIGAVAADSAGSSATSPDVPHQRHSTRSTVSSSTSSSSTSRAPPRS